MGFLKFFHQFCYQRQANEALMDSGHEGGTEEMAAVGWVGGGVGVQAGGGGMLLVKQW